MLGQRIASWLAAAMAIGTVITQVGCIALNIPSERFHDAADSGGVLGHWQRDTALCDPDAGPFSPHSRCGFRATAAQASRHASTRHQANPDRSGFCVDGGPLEVDPFDDTIDVDGNPIEPEVPWPRYLPVPTRPVFGVAIE